MGNRDERGISVVKAAACSDMNSPCFNFMKQENSRVDWRRPFASETSHAGIIRIGFEGISQPRFAEHPCFNSSIEALAVPESKSACRNAGQAKTPSEPICARENGVSAWSKHLRMQSFAG